MDFFRSADMYLYEVSIPKDNVWEVMDTFGKLNTLHFVNLNSDQQVFSLTYAQKIKRCDEALRILKGVVITEADRLKMQMVVPYNHDNLARVMKVQAKFKNKSPQAIFESIEEDIAKHSKLIIDQKNNEEGMHNQCLKLIGS